MSSTANPKKLRSGSNAIIFTLVALLSLVFLNIVSTRVFGRVDLTEDRIYTLSKASRELVANLPDRIVAKAFISKDTPPQVGQITKYLRDLLDEYKSASKGKFEWEAIDPSDAKNDEERHKKEEEAQRLGIQKLQFQQASTEKVSVGSLYLGVAFEYGDKTERLPRVVQMEGLEYEVSSILKRLTVKKKKIGFVQGQGEPDQQRGIQFVWMQLGENYDVQAVNLGGAAAAAIPDDVDVLVLMGPKQPYSEPAKKAIDGFIMKGKSVAFLVDGMTMEQPRGQMPPEMGGQMPKIARKNDTGLDAMLASYGFKINDDIVMDEQNARAPALVNGQIMVINRPYFPIVTRLGKHETTEKLRGMLFPLASSVEVTGPMKERAGKMAQTDGGELVALAQSTEKSWKQSGFFLFDPSRDVPVGNDKGPFTFGWAYKGPLRSAFAAGAPPVPSNMSAPDDKAAAASGGETKSARLVVIGDSDFASDDMMRSPDIRSSNGHFFLNIVDWLAQDETLAPVRGKGVTQRPLEVKSETTPVVAKSLNMFGLPLAFIGYGVIRWRRRSAKREHFQL